MTLAYALMILGVGLIAAAFAHLAPPRKPGIREGIEKWTGRRGPKGWRRL